ncbi:MAG: peptide chain release factor N(5)-glutamine methyltransferase [Candidatus Rokubacteria bacterium]|nr:peptide chain release factor N(5)-glutamine methyltransferase [Candidatus Rokubacteria bacterium]
MTSGVPGVAALLTAASAELEAAGVATARNDAEWLLASVLGVGRFEIYLGAHGAPVPDVVERYEGLVRRRAAGEPLQQLVGWEAFRGVRVRVTRDVLVPRPETEALVEWALALVGGDARLVVDVGTGSGCIACAMAAERPEIRVLAVDVSPAAAVVARGNAASLGLGDRIAVVTADLLGPVRDASVDMVVANPPYLPAPLLPSLQREVRDWDPHLALAAGDDGLSVLRPLIADARRVLKPGAPLVVETAGGSQADVAATLLSDSGYEDVDQRADLTGTVRFVAARWPAAPSAGFAGAIERGRLGGGEAPVDGNAGVAGATSASGRHDIIPGPGVGNALSQS